jgi:hypothetical protein
MISRCVRSEKVGDEMEADLIHLIRPIDSMRKQQRLLQSKEQFEGSELERMQREQT